MQDLGRSQLRLSSKEGLDLVLPSGIKQTGRLRSVGQGYEFESEAGTYRVSFEEAGLEDLPNMVVPQDGVEVPVVLRAAASPPPLRKRGRHKRALARAGSSDGEATRTRGVPRQLTAALPS